MARKARNTKEEQRRRVAQILGGLDRAYANAQCALEHSNALELLVATILSAQCTDERVNLVTRDLFRKYRSPEDYSNARPEELENDIRSTGFFRNKARSIQGACKLILDRFGGRVPETMEELIQLPGVARKTANVVLGVAYRKAEGIVVDTHVHRVSRRLELTQEEDPQKIERDLMKLVPRSKWIIFSHQMIHHGRHVCKARSPSCPTCPLEKFCRSKDKLLALRASSGAVRMRVARGSRQ
jgi:endonuclease-3